MIAAAARLTLILLAADAAADAEWDFGKEMNKQLSRGTEGKLKINFEFRSRYEYRGNNSFRDSDLSYDLLRTRVGVTYNPARWLRLSAMGQDGRVPLYGSRAPNNLRDTMDLQESYFELFPDVKKGFGFTGGRQMLNFGEARLVGSPQWGNLARTWDGARLYYRTPKARIEFLFLSPVKVRTDDFNDPVFGDRIWGMYNTFPDVFGKNLVDVYVLRHGQNRPGGFAGAGRLEVNTFGGRLAGPLAHGFKYSLEGALQTGEIGTAAHRAGAWFSGISRRIEVGQKKPLDLSVEYKFASGSDDPQGARVSTFDQMYPANHDKFGHQDLFGWRNIHNIRSLETMGVTRSFALNFMYGANWLASTRDAVYNGAGRSIVRSAAGTAGRFVGQELDVFATVKVSGLTFGAGYGYFFKGEFVRNTTPGMNPNFAYIFQSYSF